MKGWQRFFPWNWVTRGGLGYFVMGLIVLSGAIWSFGALVEIGNVATTKQSLTTLPVPYAGYLFAGSVDLFIFYGYLKCYGPAWQIALAVFHILIGLATSLWFQWQHSKNIVDPVWVSVVPALAVAISLDTWVVSQLVAWKNPPKNLPRRERPVPVVESAAPVVESGADAPSPTTPPDSRAPRIPVAGSLASRLSTSQRNAILAGRAKKLGGKKIAAETGIPQRLVYAYLQELREPEPAKVTTNGGGSTDRES